VSLWRDHASVEERRGPRRAPACLDEPEDRERARYVAEPIGEHCLGPLEMRTDRYDPNHVIPLTTFKRHVRRGLVPKPRFQEGDFQRLWTEDDRLVYWARMAQVGLPRRARIAATLKGGRERCAALEAQRRELRALVSKVPVGAGEVVRSAIVFALRAHGIELTT
jgi:hypothetical protein